MPIEFKHTKRFAKDVIRLRKRFRRIEEDIDALKAEMRDQHYRGDFMPGYGMPIYKVRAANRSAGRGKRGGFRIIYRPVNDELFLFLHVYSKSDKDNVSLGEVSRLLSDRN